MKCKKHPKYMGVFEPVVDCLTCWKIYGYFQHAKAKILTDLINDYEVDI